MTDAASETTERDLIDVDAAALTIDEEFAGLIPPLSEDELRELEKNLVEHGGARDPLIAWARTDGPPILLDGHNRLTICRRLGLAYTIKGIAFESRDDAEGWIERNQIGRRNLGQAAFALILGRIFNKRKWPRGGSWHGAAGEKTSKLVASEYGVSHDTVERAGRFQKTASRLGIERDIASGRIKVGPIGLHDTVKSLPKDATRAEVLTALSEKNKAKSKPGRHAVHEKSWLVPSEPTDCLKAIRFYSMSYVTRAPDSVDALNELLARLIDENRERVRECA
jgi:hypothetical protein